jgi:hypothetical protein
MEDVFLDGPISLRESPFVDYQTHFSGLNSTDYPLADGGVKFCGEDATYSLYINATAWTSPTNRTNPDTDAYENPAG